MAGGEKELEGAAGGEVAEALEVEGRRLGERAEVAGGAVGEGPGEAAVKDEQQMAARQVAQRLAKGGHGPVGGGVVAASVGGQQEAGELVLVVGMRQTMAREVDEEPVGRLREGRKVVGKEVGEGREGGLRVEESEHLEALALQGSGDGVGIAHGIEKGRNALGIGVDADDHGEAVLEARRGSIGVGGSHRRAKQADVSPGIPQRTCGPSGGYKPQPQAGVRWTETSIKDEE
jgi:hypothetical protein